MTYKFWIPGQPVAKGRPRFGKGRTYTPKATKDAEEAAQLYLRSEARRQKVDIPISTPVTVTLTFFFEPAISRTKKDVEEIFARLPFPPHTGKPDTDNLIKTILDAMNGVILVDDAQVWQIKASKVWCRQRPGIEVLLEVAG